MADAPPPPPRAWQPWSVERRRRVAYIDAFSGVAGDMLLAAVLDAGCPLEGLQTAEDARPVWRLCCRGRRPTKVPLPGFQEAGGWISFVDPHLAV